MSFSYFVSFEVLKTPFMFTAEKAIGNSEWFFFKLEINILNIKHTSFDYKGTLRSSNTERSSPERSDNGKKWARNIIIRPQNTTSFACIIRCGKINRWMVSRSLLKIWWERGGEEFKNEMTESKISILRNITISCNLYLL